MNQYQNNNMNPNQNNKKGNGILKKMLLIYGIVLAVAILVIFLLFATKILCIHKWQAATCTSPEVCARCAETRGEMAEHEWTKGDCETPQKCKSCGKTNGIAPGHKWQAATCQSPSTCTVCGKTNDDQMPHKWELDENNNNICAYCGENENGETKSDEKKNKKAPFYAILCYAAKEKDDAKKFAKEVTEMGFDGKVHLSTDWGNFNKEKWYVVSAEMYKSEDEAKKKLSDVQECYPDAYVKYSGDWVGGN